MEDTIHALDAEAIHKIVLDCLFRPEEVKDGKMPENGVKGVAVMSTFGFHRERLESHRNEVRAALTELPDGFHVGKGGGQSFLSMCMDKNDRQWGEHINIDELIALGNALGYVSFPLPRDMWSVLPGGMPYVTVQCG